MKKLYLTALLALPLLATPIFADGGPGCCMNGGIALNFRFNCCGPYQGGTQLGPWYHYWPLEAHFTTPAPTGYPYWPLPQALAPAKPVLPLPSATPQLQPEARPAGPEVKPVGYFYYPYSSTPQNIIYGPAPSYWTPRP